MEENLQKIVSKEVKKIQESRIPITAPISESIEEYDNYKIVLSFIPYKQNCCELAKLQRPEAKKLTSELKKITKTLKKHFRHQDVSGIACKPIEDGGNYSPLFVGLGKDIELLEIDYTKAGRVFGYITKNIFNVVAIKTKHIKTSKYT